MRTVNIEEPLLRVQDQLGEAPVWDFIRQKLYWVDIDGRRLHSYDPKLQQHTIDHYEHKISAIACTDQNDGLIGAIDDGFAFIPFDILGLGKDKSIEVEVIGRVPLEPGEKRFNEGMVDPAGRFLAGTMGKAHGTYDGRMFALAKGTVQPQPVKQGITCTNGMAWINGGKQMYFTDSWDKRIDLYDYEVASGSMSNRRLFVGDLGREHGWPDGLCLDTEGGVWTARWGAGKVIRLSPKGEIDVVIEFPRAWNMTSCIFGGPNMDELYVTSADTDIEGDAGIDRPDGGSLFVVKELGFRGPERSRYVR